MSPLLMFVHYLDLHFLQFLVPKLSSIKFKECIVKDSFAFPEEIVHKNSKLFMGSLNVVSLFTNIYLLKSANLLYNNEDVIEDINKSDFKNFLSLATQESYFKFNDVLYKQKDAWPWDRLLGLLWQRFSCHFMK